MKDSNRKYKEDKCFWKKLIQANIFDERLLVPSLTIILNLSVECTQPPQPPILLRMRVWHMWQLRSKQGVEPPTRWDPGLFATFRQSWLRWGSLHPAHQPVEFLLFHLDCAAWIQNHGQIPRRRRGFQPHPLWIAPHVSYSSCRRN